MKREVKSFALRYFVSFIVQFQFYEALCTASGQYIPDDPNKPLYLCDFSLGGTQTGEVLGNVMKPGFLYITKYVGKVAFKK